MTGGGIFISYRRDETAYPAGWLFERLEDHYGRGQVFKDIDSIEPGDDFVERISSAVASCDVLLALIGSNWLGERDAGGARRIDDPGDFVRVEIQAALARGVRVVPLLVGDARMPAAEQLPEALAPLARRQALELRPSHFEFETSRLLKVIDETLAQRRGPPPAGSKRRRNASWVAAGVAALALVAVVVTLVLPDNPSGRGSPVRAGAIFADDFATRAGGWDDAGAQRDGGHYDDGAYRLYTHQTPTLYSRHGYPRRAAKVFPEAPRDITVAVTARRTLGGDQDTAYGVLCRAAASGESYYEFVIWHDHATIAKVTPDYDELETNADLSTVRPRGDNRLQARCATDASGAATLVFTVNGTELVRAVDRRDPLPGGTAGLVVRTGGGRGEESEARFDDFAVTA